MPDGHYGTKAFMGDLSRAFFDVESDKEQLRKKLMEEERWGAPGTPTRAAWKRPCAQSAATTFPHLKSCGSVYRK